jgi:hypothetical protein
MHIDIVAALFDLFSMCLAHNLIQYNSQTDANFEPKLMNLDLMSGKIASNEINTLPPLSTL